MQFGGNQFPLPPSNSDCLAAEERKPEQVNAGRIRQRHFAIAQSNQVGRKESRRRTSFEMVPPTASDQRQAGPDLRDGRTVTSNLFAEALRSFHSPTYFRLGL